MAQAHHRSTIEPRPIATAHVSGQLTGALLPRSTAYETDVAGIEVVVAWGDCVIGVTQHCPPREVCLGEARPDGSPCDFLIPSERLAYDYLPIVKVDGGRVLVTLPAAADGYLDDGQGGRVALGRLRAEAEPSIDVPGARRYGLLPHETVMLTLGVFSVRVRAVDAMERPKGAFIGEEQRGILGAFVASFLAASVWMGSMAYFVPSLNGLEDEGFDEDDVRLIQQYIAASALRELENQPVPQAEPTAAGERGGQSGHRSPGDEGKTGSLTSKRTGGRLGIRGPKDNPDPHLGRAEEVELAKSFGIVELLGTMNVAHRQGMASPWGTGTALGRDDLDAMGNLFGDSIHDSAGMGGLGLTGTGQGGGCVGAGCGAGIGMDRVGTIGGGFGCDPSRGPCDGMGRGIGRGVGNHRTRVPSIRPSGNLTLSGRLPPEVIQRIVRQNFGRFRYCYEQGLAKNPNLEGRVVVRFVIGRDGAVASAQGGGSDLPDSSVNSCIIQAFYGLSFPAPEGGLVTVSYPIALTPG